MSPVLMFAFLSLVSSVYATVQCLNENGQAVDWWFIYKMPNGFRYAYLDSDDTSGKLAPFTDRTLDRLDGALGSTLHQIYVNKKRLGYVIYNDELPDSARMSSAKGMVHYLLKKAGLAKESSSGAHAKGVVATDGSTGFWMVHSVPKFPDLGPPSFTWTADDTYGQSFLCMSLAAAQIDKVGLQLQYFHPTLFDSNMPDSAARAVPHLAGVYSGDRIVGTNVETLTTLGGQRFTSFAKDKDSNMDLYDDLVSPTLKVGFKWETWRRGGVLPSVCANKRDAYDVINVLSMQVGDTAFEYTKDHAKIGVATASTGAGGYVCVGDINRMESQRKRGGGTVCFLTRGLYKALAAAITDTERCDA